ncbi:MAG: peptidoglycan-binding protein [Geminicoccaceae bacterium]|nr:peptidoglycan-binding protein [Geminicoccaceae bacterium]
MLPMLKRGMKGGAVRHLQARLKVAGFDPGRIDGAFGPATEAALMAFQQAEGLLPDGVAGPRSWAALDPEAKALAGDALGLVDVDLAAVMFPSTPLGAIRVHLPHVVAGLREAGLVDGPMALMALATIRAETEGFEPVAERPSRFNTSPFGHPFDLYDRRRDLGNGGRPDGARYRGRGFVQLTGRANYRRAGERLGLGDALAAEPERACEPALAGRILAAYLAERERPIKLALLAGDLGGARRTVNGGGHGIGRFRDAYRLGERELRARERPASQAARSRP